MKPSQILVIKELISKSNTEDAIIKFKKVVIQNDPDAEGTLITMEAAVNELKENYLRGLIEDAEYRREKLKINYRVLELLNNISKKIVDKDAKLRKDKKWITDPISRQEMLGYFAKELIDEGETGVIRQKAALSSFSMPNRETGDPIWKERDGNEPRTRRHYESSWIERKWMEHHVKETYCRLILDPSIAKKIAESRGKKAATLRLKCLLEFLQANRDRVDVITTDDLTEENIIIVGNWFYSHSRRPTDKGYQEATFEWEKSLVEEQNEKFDSEFQRLLDSKGLDIYTSKEETIREIKGILEDIS